MISRHSVTHHSYYRYPIRGERLIVDAVSTSCVCPIGHIPEPSSTGTKESRGDSGPNTDLSRITGAVSAIQGLAYGNRGLLRSQPSGSPDYQPPGGSGSRSRFPDVSPGFALPRMSRLSLGLPGSDRYSRVDLDRQREGFNRSPRCFRWVTLSGSGRANRAKDASHP